MQLLAQPAAAQPAEPWQIVVSAALQSDEAVRLVLADLRETGKAYGLDFDTVNDHEPLAGNAILVGDASRNTQTARLIASGDLALQGGGDDQGYEIRTLGLDGNRTVVVAGNSVIGDVYGLYWVWDRIRVHKHIPHIDVVRTPAMKIRVGAAWGRFGFGGRTKEQMHLALRHSTNWVSGPAVLDLVL